VSKHTRIDASVAHGNPVIAGTRSLATYTPGNTAVGAGSDAARSSYADAASDHIVAVPEFPSVLQCPEAAVSGASAPGTCSRTGASQPVRDSVGSWFYSEFGEASR